MYLFYDSNGTLKEIVNKKSFRVENSAWNKIYAYWDNNAVVNLLEINYTLPNGTHSIHQIQTPSKVTKQLPYDKKVDLQFFKYFTDYSFFEISVPDNILALTGAVGFEINLTTATQSITLGANAFMVEGLDDFLPDENINVAQWNELKKLLSQILQTPTFAIIQGSPYDNANLTTALNSKQDTLTAGEGIDITNNVISAINTTVEWGNITGTLANQTDLQSALNEKANTGDIPIVNNPTITIQKNGVSVDTFTLNQNTAKSINITDVASASDLSDVEALIPSQATAQNQLADKDFVNSSIATNTAYFLGTLDVVSDLGLTYGATTTAIATALDSHTFASKTNNDYVFVINKDTDNNTIYQRFKYNGSNFLYEYALNNSSFTANQWNAINSGATDVLIGKITTNESAIATEITDRQTAVSNEATTRSTADTGLQTNIDNEKSRAEQVESELDTRLDTIEADYLKASDKTALQSQITENANDIDTLESDLSAETSNRESADSELQDSIDEINDSAVMISGIDSTKVAQIQTNADNIATKQNKVYLSIVNGMLCITYEI